MIEHGTARLESLRRAGLQERRRLAHDVVNGRDHLVHLHERVTLGVEPAAHVAELLGVRVSPKVDLPLDPVEPLPEVGKRHVKPAEQLGNIPRAYVGGFLVIRHIRSIPRSTYESKAGNSENLRIPGTIEGMAADETPAPPEHDDGGERLDFGTGDKALAAVLLIGAFALAYICLDVMAGGAITRTLSREPE